MNAGTSCMRLVCAVLFSWLAAMLFPAMARAVPIEYRQTMVRVLREGDVQGWPSGYATAPRYPEFIVVSANGSKVGFVVKLNNYTDRHIYVMNADGSGLVDLTAKVPAGVGLGTPQINDDGSRLFFWDYGNGNIYYFDTSPPYDIHPAYKPDAFWLGSKRSYSLNGAGTVIYLKHFWQEGGISHYGLCSTAVGSNVLNPVVDVLSLTPAKTADYDLQFLDAARSGGRLLLSYYPDYWHDQRKVMWETGPLQPVPDEWHDLLWDNASTALQYCHITSSDGSRALYSFQNKGFRPELHLLDLDTGAKTLLLRQVDGFDFLTFPALSPDGTVARWGSSGYNATRIILSTGDLRDTLSSRFPESAGVGNSNLTDITADNRYYFMGSGVDGNSRIHRIDMAPVGTAPAPNVTSIAFGRPQLIYGDQTPVTITVGVSDPKGVGNIHSVQMQTLVEGRERPHGQTYAPLTFTNPLTGTAGVYSGTVYPNPLGSVYAGAAFPVEVGVRIVVRNKDEHYQIADTRITVLPSLFLEPVTTPTSLSSQTIGGSVATGSTVTVSLNGGSATPATVNGTAWSYLLQGLAWGDNTITVTATDSQGHVSTRTVTIARRPKLAVTLLGDGGGTVSSDPAGISCGSGACSAFFPFNSDVALMAVPASSSLFGGWGGAGSGSGNLRDVTLDGGRAVTATFNGIKPVRVLQTLLSYPTIHEAYAAVPAGGTIQAREYGFVEDLLLQRPVPVLLKGGYGEDYSTNSAYSTVDGTVTVAFGTLTLERIVVK